MPNGFDYDDDDDDFTPPTDDNLRTHARKLEKQNKAMAAKLAEYEAKDRKALIAQAVTAKGLNPLIAEMIPADVKGPEDVSGWLDKFGGLFGPATPEPPAPPKADESGAGAGNPGPSGLATNLDPAVLREMEKQANAEASSSSSEIGAVEAALANATSQEDIKALIAQHGSLRG